MFVFHLSRALLAILVAMTLAVGCNSSADCSNGTCVCGQNDQCGFTCDAPPCHVDCASGSSCSGTCSNGTCTCEQGASCSFECSTPPCHVACDGQNTSCAGTCANGSCTCGSGSTCSFTCAAGPCHTTCADDAKCVVECPNAGVAGTEDCDITACGSGAAILCPDKHTLACNASCPGD